MYETRKALAGKRFRPFQKEFSLLSRVHRFSSP
jgi:hypothetical protein